jgi:hypothetical protein
MLSRSRKIALLSLFRFVYLPKKGIGARFVRLQIQVFLLTGAAPSCLWTKRLPSALAQ